MNKRLSIEVMSRVITATMIVGSFFTETAAAAPDLEINAKDAYELKLDLVLKGKPTSSSKVIVRKNEKTMLTQKTDMEESFIEVVATEELLESGKYGINMTFNVGTVSKDQKRTIQFSHRIITMENEEAKVTVFENDGVTEEYSLAVIARRKNDQY